LSGTQDDKIRSQGVIFTYHNLYCVPPDYFFINFLSSDVGRSIIIMKRKEKTASNYALFFLCAIGFISDESRASLSK
jgi:hypothetical protein